MEKTNRTVFVLGAGFTRAFVPDAPLLYDDYGIDSLIEEFSNFQYARQILEYEKQRSVNGKINIERLMTRLEGRMPYDFERGADEEIGLLLHRLKNTFVNRLELAKRKKHESDLANFARYCIENHVDCVTFNYDDVLDEALWRFEKTKLIPEAGKLYWHPDGGYGFFCMPSESLLKTSAVAMDKTSMLLLKLHGSVNWRIKRGYTRPYVIDALVHHEGWLERLPSDMIREPQRVDLHLEPEPFIVPPVLDKSSLVSQPILRLTWSLAYAKLVEANSIVFIGYSLPVTDIATGFLFGEAVAKADVSKIKVVNFQANDTKRELLIAAYRQVFPKIDSTHFDFRDALEWSREITHSQIGAA